MARLRARGGFPRPSAASCGVARPARRACRRNIGSRRSVSSMRCRNAAPDGSAREGEPHRARRRCGDGERKAAVARAASRSGGRRSGRAARAKSCGRRCAARAPRRAAKSRAAIRRAAGTLRWGPSTKSVTATRRSPPSGVQMVQTPSSAAVSEIIGPAGSAMQMLPPTVAMFQILNEARKARQHWPMSGAAAHSGGNARASRAATVQVAAISRPSAETDRRRPAEAGEVDQPRERRLRLGEQPGAAGEPSVAGAPRRHLAAISRPRDLGDGVQVHAKCLIRGVDSEDRRLRCSHSTKQERCQDLGRGGAISRRSFTPHP